MDQRIQTIRQQTEQFGITRPRLAEASGLSLTTVKKTLSPVGADKRYLTESNVSAIETGIEKILEEYRQKLCGQSAKLHI